MYDGDSDPRRVHGTAAAATDRDGDMSDARATAPHHHDCDVSTQ